MKPEHLPRVYKYTDFHAFLDDCVKVVLSENPKIGQRSVNKLFGFSSPNFIQNLIKNKKNISKDTIALLRRKLSLDKSESEYFTNLVNFNQADAIEEKLRYQSLLMRSKGFVKYKKVESLQYQYFSNWAMIALREMCTLRGFDADPASLKENFKNEFTSDQLKGFITALESLRLIEKKPDGTWSRPDEDLITPPGLASGFIFEFHKMMIERGAHALFNQESKQRDFSTVSLSFDKSKVEEAREFLENVRSEFIAKFSAPKEGDSVYTLNMQLFCLAFLLRNSK